MHDILKQPTFTYLTLPRLLRNLPRVQRCRGLRNYVLPPWRKQQDLPKMALGLECRLMRLVQFPKFRTASCGTLKSGVLQHGRWRTVTPFYVQWQRPIERSCTWLQFSTSPTFLHTFCMHFCAFFLQLQPLCKLVATCELDNHLRTICKKKYYIQELKSIH